MYFFFDTETNKKYDFKKDVHDEEQPYIMQLAAKVFNINREVVFELNTLIQPTGLYDDLAEEAFRIHGISIKDCNRYGVGPEQLARVLFKAIESSEYMIGHNLVHDHNMVTRHFEAIGLKEFEQYFPEERFCTMQTFTQKYKLPQYSWNKWPTLQEMHEFFFNEKFDGAHDAMADVNATARCFFEMMDKEEYLDYDAPC